MGDAGGRSVLRTRTRGFAFPGDTFAEEMATGRSTFSLSTSGLVDDDFGEVVPAVPDMGLSTWSAGTSGRAGGHTAESGRSTFGLVTAGFALRPDEAAGRSTFGFSTTGGEPASFANTIFFADRRPLFGGYAGVFVDGVEDAVAAGEDVLSLPSYAVVERFRVSGVPDDTFTGLARARDRIELGDLLAVVLRELLREGFALDASVADNFRAAVAVMDALRLSGVAASALEAANLLTAALAFGDLLRRADVEGLTDGLLASAEASTSVRLASRLVEGLLLEAEGGPAVVLGALARDGLAMGAEGAAVLSAVEALREGLDFVLHLNVDDGHYMAYVINTESKGLTEYGRYPFNSFARIGDRYFGMTPDGIRELEGPDDAGSPIAARLRLAMTTLGTGQMKRMIAAYLGYTSSGELRLKTITVGVDGVRQANHYRLHAQPADNPREARIQIGQGLRSVYWGFEIEAIDGAAFMLDVLALHPIVVEQRIQGEGGGKR